MLLWIERSNLSVLAKPGQVFFTGAGSLTHSLYHCKSSLSPSDTHLGLVPATLGDSIFRYSDLGVVQPLTYEEIRPKIELWIDVVRARGTVPDGRRPCGSSHDRKRGTRSTTDSKTDGERERDAMSP